MLAVSWNVVVIYVPHDVADMYVLQHLTANAGHGYRPVVTGFKLFNLLVEPFSIHWGLILFEGILVNYAEKWGYLF